MHPLCVNKVQRCTFWKCTAPMVICFGPFFFWGFWTTSSSPSPRQTNLHKPLR